MTGRIPYLLALLALVLGSAAAVQAEPQDAEVVIFGPDRIISPTQDAYGRPADWWSRFSGLEVVGVTARPPYFSCNDGTYRVRSIDWLPEWRRWVMLTEEEPPCPGYAYAVEIRDGSRVFSDGFESGDTSAWVLPVDDCLTSPAASRRINLDLTRRDSSLSRAAE